MTWVVQYARPEDKIVAELVAERVNGTVKFFDSGIAYTVTGPTIVIGGQNANATYRYYARLGYVPWLTDVDKGKGKIFKRHTGRGNLYFLAGYETEDTAAACLYVFENGLPDSDTEITTPGKDPIVVELKGDNVYHWVGNEQLFISRVNEGYLPNGYVAKFVHINGDVMKVAVWKTGSPGLGTIVAIAAIIVGASILTGPVEAIAIGVVAAVYYLSVGSKEAQAKVMKTVSESYSEIYTSLVNAGLPPDEASIRALEVVNQANEISKQESTTQMIKSLLYTSVAILGVGVAAYIALKFIFKD